MKKILSLSLAFVLITCVSFAQTTQSKPAVKKPVTTKPAASTTKPVAAKPAAGPLRKDGKPDMRYKANKPATPKKS